MLSLRLALDKTKVFLIHWPCCGPRPGLFVVVYVYPRTGSGLDEAIGADSLRQVAFRRAFPTTCSKVQIGGESVVTSRL